MRRDGSFKRTVPECPTVGRFQAFSAETFAPANVRSLGPSGTTDSTDGPGMRSWWW